jgi:hypothetical protein
VVRLGYKIVYPLDIGGAYFLQAPPSRVGKEQRFVFLARQCDDSKRQLPRYGWEVARGQQCRQPELEKLRDEAIAPDRHQQCTEARRGT